MRLFSLSVVSIIASTLSMTALTGCGVANQELAGAGSARGAAVTGHVIGGQQPVSGSQLYVLQASNTGYGAAATNLLTTGKTGVVAGGTYGNYVATGQYGEFDVTGDYTCTVGAPVYVLSLGGNPGMAAGTNNAALALIAPLGICPSGGFTDALQVTVNEVSTVATAYAMSGYLTGPASLGYPAESSGLALTGLTNAMANAGQLADQASGLALSTTPSGTGTVPTNTINTLADILASCVNSNGALTQTVGGVTSNTNCGNLFQYTTVGTVVPSDTVTAVLNMAHYPAVNVANLEALVGTIPPFQPTAAPSNLLLSIAYNTTQNGVPATASTGVPAVDASGNVWFPTQITAVQSGTTFYASVLQGLTPLGVPIANSDTFDGGTTGLGDITTPMQAAIDQNGNIWAAINSYGAVIRYDPVNDAPFMYFYNQGSNDDGHQLTIDTTGNVYVSDYTQGQIFKLTLSGGPETFASTAGTDYGVAQTNTGNIVSGYSNAGGPTPDLFAETTNVGGTVTSPTNTALHGQIALPGNATPNSFAADGNGNVWVTDIANHLFKYNEATVTAGGTNISQYSGGGLQSNPTAWPVVWLAVDGGGNVWVPNYGSTTIPGNMSVFSNSGTPISPSTGYVGQTACSAQGLAIDGSGNVWLSCANSTTPVLEFIGAAVPVYTPIAAGHYGSRP